MYLSESALEKPDVRVIEIAIARLESGEDEYSCIALDVAASKVHPKIRPSVLWIYHGQFSQYVASTNNGELPMWWNKKSHGSAPRIEALKGFRDACVKAFNKQKKAK